MSKTLKKFMTFLGVFALALFIASPAQALHSPQHYSLFDDASLVSPGNASLQAVELVSDDSPGWGGVDYGVEEGLTFADLTNLSTDYMFESDDSCMGGSPRFQVGVVDPETGDEGNIFVYIGPPPSYTGCPSGVWVNSGNVLGTTVDTSQIGGSFYDPYATALLNYGDFEVTGIQLVADGGWAALDGEQTVTVDNTLINTTLFTYEPTAAAAKEMCKNGGWMTMTDGDGNSFKNQGQCVSYFAMQQND
jgi:hypothetical protein